MTDNTKEYNKCLKCKNKFQCAYYIHNVENTNHSYIKYKRYCDFYDYNEYISEQLELIMKDYHFYTKALNKLQKKYSSTDTQPIIINKLQEEVKKTENVYKFWSYKLKGKTPED